MYSDTGIYSERLMANSNIARSIATGFGIGSLPIAPGTWASLFCALPVFVLPNEFTPWVYAGLAIVSILLGLWSIPLVQPHMGSDPKPVVIDEIAGMSLVCILPTVIHSPWWWLAGFLLFRVFDIAKPWPANIVNDRTEGWAVVLDDLIAAGYTILALQMGFFVLQIATIWLQSP